MMLLFAQAIDTEIHGCNSDITITKGFVGNMEASIQQGVSLSHLYIVMYSLVG